MIISFFITIYQKLKTAYENSLTAKFLRGLSKGAKVLFSNSGILKFIARKDFYTRVWEYSGIYIAVNWIINFIPRMLGRFYSKHEAVFSESLVVRFLKFILRRFEVLISLCLVIMVIVPHEPWNDAYSIILVMFLAFMYFIKIIFHKYEGFNLKAIDFALFLFMVLACLAVATSVLPGTGIKYLAFYFASFLLVLTIVSSIKTERSLGLFLDIFLVGITITGLYGIWQAKVVGIPVDPATIDIVTNSNAKGRIFSTVGNSNNYAEILLATLPLYMAVILNSKTFLKKVVYMLLAVPSLIALVWTGARMAWIAFAAAVILYAFFKNKKLIPVFIIIGLLCIPIIPQSIYRRLTSISLADSSIAYRISIYKTVLPMLQDVWTTGVGLGTDAFMKVCGNYYLYTKKVPPHAHNIYLQIWLEFGLAGIMAFVWFIVRLVKKCIINICDKTDKYINNILVAGVAGITGILLMGMSEYIWYYPRVMIVFWTVIGVILAALGISNGRREGISQKSL